ncbi:MAG: Abortive infection protein [Acidobacteriaceae bacterium]|nr:Abortive infection protein [Acidobacteriaceae bacterium]
MEETRPSREPLAPLWHTALLLVFVLGFSWVEVLTQHLTGNAALRGQARQPSHVVSYLITLAWEWLLLAFVWWGLRLRGTPLRQLLGVRRAGATELWLDIAIALGFWFGSLAVLGIAASLLRFAHLHPENVRGIVSKLAPASPAELALWTALSISAGFCEELIFRGYLQQQFTALTRRAVLGIAIAAILFGAAHLYEGVSGALLIMLYGALFGALVHLRRSLRPGIFAHAWHDALSGFVLYLGAHFFSRLPH